MTEPRDCLNWNKQKSNNFCVFFSQVNTEENLQLLLAAQAKIDAKIETTEKRIKIEQAEVETLNRDIFQAEQYQNRSLVSH